MSRRIGHGSFGRGGKGRQAAHTRNYVNTKSLIRDTIKLGKKVSKAASDAVGGAVSDTAAYAMSFDDVETTPWATDQSGHIILSGQALEERLGGDIEAILAAQMNVATSSLQQRLQKGLKEALE